MEKKQNEFRFSAMRQFGAGESISVTSVIYSEDKTLSEKEITDQIESIDLTFNKAFRKVEERNINDKDTLAEFADKRREKMKKYDDAVRAEMEQVKASKETARDAQKLSDKISKK